MKKPIPKSINKWQKEIEKVFDIAFKGIPLKSTRPVTVAMLEKLVYDGAKCYRKYRNCEGSEFSVNDAMSGSGKYFFNKSEIATDCMVIAAYLWAHELNNDISHEDGVSIFKSLESRLGSI
jgi:hypothetical protein